jgi:DNA ligase-1
MYRAADIFPRYRFPSYIGVAIDKDEPKDAEIPEHRKAGVVGAADA